MQALAWKWTKPPKPQELRKLLPGIRKMATGKLQDLSPSIARQIVERIRYHSTIADDGIARAIPEYSARYKKGLIAAGESTTPDYTVTGNLLNHLSGRVRVKSAEQVELRIAPYGRASSAAGVIYAKGKKGRKGTEREGYYYRQPYTYKIFRTGQVVSVAGQWLRMPANETKATKKLRTKRTVYNAHLANQIAMRLGGGSWAKGGRPPTSFLTLTDAESRRIETILMKGHREVAKEILRNVAGR